MSNATTPTTTPSDAQLRDAIESLILSGLPQNTGVEKVKSHVKTEKPKWNVTSKRVREGLKKVVEEMNHVDGEFGVEDRLGMMHGGGCPFHHGEEDGGKEDGGNNRSERRKKDKEKRRVSKGKFPQFPGGRRRSSGPMDSLADDFADMLRGPNSSSDGDDEDSELGGDISIWIIDRPVGGNTRGNGNGMGTRMITEGRGRGGMQEEEDEDEAYSIIVDGQSVGLRVVEPM